MTPYPSQRHGMRHWFLRMLKLGLAMLLAFLAGAAAMHLGMHADDQDHMQAMQTQLATQQADLNQARADLATAHNQADVQAGTQRALQDSLTNLQTQLSQVRDQLSFYEQLIPPGPAGTLTIRALDVQPDGEFLRYRVLLTRNAEAGAEPFKGRMRFVAQAVQQGKTVKIDLNPAQAEGGDATPAEPADALSLVFNQFQRSTGVLQMPSQVQIRAVRLEILEGDTVRATEDVALNRTGNPVQESQP